MYLSRTGEDNGSCDQKDPCNTIRWAVTLATHDDLIYLDGTNTSKNPYTCDSGTSHPGIYINKSLSLIGFGNPLPRIRCSGGSFLAFNGSADALHEIRANISGIFFSGSSLTFLESSAYIQNCKFNDRQEGVKFTIHKMIDSSLHIKDTIFSENMAGISVDLAHTNQDISFDLTLENVTLIHNQFSPKGLISLNMKNGNHIIHFKDVTFIDNCASGYQHEPTECIVQSTRAAVTIFIDSSHFQGQQTRLFAISGSNISLFIHNSSFVGYKVGPAYGNGGVVYLSGDDHPEQRAMFHVGVSNSTFVNASATQGGAIAVDSINACNISFRDSIFTGNTAKAGEGGAVFIGSSGSVFHDDKNTTNRTFGEALSVTEPDGCYITIECSTFSNNSAYYNGGAVSVSAKSPATIILQNVTMESNKAENFGGAIYVSGAGDGEGETFGSKELSNLCFRDSIFTGNTALYGGALSVESKSNFVPAIVINNSTFFNCSAKQVGGAFYMWADGIATVEVKRARFVGNHAFKYYGGAAAIFVNQENSGGASPLLFEDTTFEKNAAVFGGAVHLSNGDATFQNCTFLNNLVQVLGGHIHTDVQSTNLFIWDCVFNQTLFQLGNENYSAGAFFIDTQSKGSLSISNTSLTANYPANHDVLIRKTNGREVSLDNLTTLTCPVGSQINVLYFQIKLEGQSSVTILEVRCLACEGSTYSLNRGRAFGLQEGREFPCLSCPYGANCTQNIVAEPNFWGFREKYNPSTLNFITCPHGYCSSPQEADFPEYDSCQGNRSGTLCGHCKESHTETLYSTSCAPSNECKDHWIWPVGLVYVSIMALLFTFKPPIVSWIKRQILWFKTYEPANQDEDFDRGYLKIAFFFYQAANLLLVSDTTLHILKTEVWEPIIGLFNFQHNVSPVSTTGVICPFPGLSAVTKRLLLASPVFGTMLMIGVFYMLHWGSKKIQGREAPPVGPYIGGILQTILLGYATLASMSFDLLTCVPIRSEKRLFYDGNIACFQPWQFLFVAFDCVFFVPFLFVLMWGSFKLYRGTVSVTNFLLACCLPLPILLYWAYIALIYRARPLVRVREQPAGQASTEISVERVLYDPFKRPEEGSKLSLSWEGVMIGWRLILIVLNAFINDPLSRLLVMTSFCVLFLLHHCIAQPFRDDIANTVETISLLCVVQLGIINTFFASFHSLSVPLQGSNPLISWTSAFQVVEIIILGFVPAVACLFVVAVVLSQSGRLLVVLYQTIRHLAKLCYSRPFRKQENEETPLLV